MAKEESPDYLINYGDKKMDSATETFTSNVRFSEQAIFKELRKLFENVDIASGKLSSNAKTTQFLLSLEARISEALKKSGYNQNVLSFLKNFDTIKKNNIEIQSSLNGLNIAESSLDDITKLEVQNTIDKLTGSGISKDFIVPIRESLYRNVALGADINTAQQTIESYILSNDGKDSRLLRYTSQVARDSISQYDGAVQTLIKNELELSDYLYAGSLIEDSRAQCSHWVKQKRLKGADLAGEIETALEGGYLSGRKCNGMIPGTTIDTFSIYRGGYNCRHRAIPTKFR